MMATYEAPIVQPILPEFLRDLQHIPRDARRAHEPPNTILAPNRFLTPLRQNAHSRPEQLKCPRIRRVRVQETVALLRVPNASLRRAREAVRARRTCARPAGVEPEHVEARPKYACEVRADHADPLRPGGSGSAWVDEHRFAIAEGWHGAGNEAEGDGSRARVGGVRPVKGKEEAGAVVPVETGSPGNFGGRFELWRTHIMSCTGQIKVKGPAYLVPVKVSRRDARFQNLRHETHRSRQRQRPRYDVDCHESPAPSDRPFSRKTF